MGITQRLGTIPLAISTDTSNNVGIGGSPSGSYKLEVTGSGRYLSGNEALRLDTTSTAFDTSIRFYNNNSATYWGGIQAGPGAISGGGMNIYNNGAYPMAFNVNGAERMRINSSGQVLIGTTTTDTSLSVDIQNLSPTSNNVFLRIKNNNGSEDVGLKIAGTFGTAYEHTIGVNTIIASGDLCFHNSNSLGYRWFVDGSQKMRIFTDGQVSMNTDSILSAAWLSISVASNNYNAIVLRDTGTSYSSGNYYQLFTNSSNTLAGSISHNTITGVNFNTSSDYRLKEDLKDFDGLDILTNIKFYDFKWKDEDKRMHGVIAHELESLIPLAVSGTKDGIDKEGNIVSQGVDYSKLVPILGKAIQELSAQNQDLKSRLDKAGL